MPGRLTNRAHKFRKGGSEGEELHVRKSKSRNLQSLPVGFSQSDKFRVNSSYRDWHKNYTKLTGRKEEWRVKEEEELEEELLKKF